MTQNGTDHKMRCYDCGTVYKPLTKEAAIQLATDHCERFEHSNVHAEPRPDTETEQMSQDEIAEYLRRLADEIEATTERKHK